jgi:hypothetical protein
VPALAGGFDLHGRIDSELRLTLGWLGFATAGALLLSLPLLTLLLLLLARLLLLLLFELWPSV